MSCDGEEIAPTTLSTMAGVTPSDSHFEEALNDEVEMEALKDHNDEDRENENSGEVNGEKKKKKRRKSRSRSRSASRERSEESIARRERRQSQRKKRRGKRNGTSSEEMEDMSSEDNLTDLDDEIPVQSPNENEDEDGQRDKKKKKKKEEMRQVSLFKLLSPTTPLERVGFIVAVLCSMASGAVQPAFAIIFGGAIDEFTNPTALTDGSLDYLILSFVYLAIGALVVTYVQIALFSSISQRVANRTRNNFLEGILRQDIGWFDFQNSGSLISRMAGDVDLIQEGIGERIGKFFEAVTAFVAGFIIGFVYSWKLSLVILSIVPIIAACGAFMGKVVAWSTSGNQTAFAKSSAAATEVIGNIRTVFAYGAEEKEALRFEKALDKTKRLGTIRSFASGGGIGTTMFIMFCSYSLSFYYSSLLVETGELSPGDMMVVFFSLVMGSMALGNAAEPVSALNIARGAGAFVYEVI